MNERDRRCWWIVFDRAGTSVVGLAPGLFREGACRRNNSRPYRSPVPRPHVEIRGRIREEWYGQADQQARVEEWERRRLWSKGCRGWETLWGWGPEAPRFALQLDRVGSAAVAGSLWHGCQPSTKRRQGGGDDRLGGGFDGVGFSGQLSKCTNSAR